MTREAFRKRIIRSNLVDICLYSLVFAAMIVGGIIFLYDIITHQAKWNPINVRVAGYLVLVFLFYFGLRGLYLMPNRYKVLAINSTLSDSRKKNAILNLVQELGDRGYKEDRDLYIFTYQRKWWTSEYQVYTGYDDEHLFASVQGVTSGAYGRGIMDLGQTEKLRTRILSILMNNLS